MNMAETTSYHLKGMLLAACNCDWGCPCNFEAPPTKGFCEGGYLWHVQEGTYEQVALHGLNFAWYAHSPGPLHLGNLTSLYLVDERATPAQRQAIEALLTTNPTVLPFSVPRRLTSPTQPVRRRACTAFPDGVREGLPRALVSRDKPFPGRGSWPNTYEDPRCQETNPPYERIFSFFSAVLTLVQSGF